MHVTHGNRNLLSGWNTRRCQLQNMEAPNLDHLADEEKIRTLARAYYDEALDLSNAIEHGYPLLKDAVWDDPSSVWMLVSARPSNFQHVSDRLRGTTYTRPADDEALTFIEQLVNGISDWPHSRTPAILYYIPLFMSANPPPTLRAIAKNFVDSASETDLVQVRYTDELRLFVGDEWYLAHIIDNQEFLASPDLQKRVRRAMRRNLNATGSVSLIHVGRPPFLDIPEIMQVLRNVFLPHHAAALFGAPDEVLGQLLTPGVY
jgi:hypothetical protein